MGRAVGGRGLEGVGHALASNELQQARRQWPEWVGSRAARVLGRQCGFWRGWACITLEFNDFFNIRKTPLLSC